MLWVPAKVGDIDVSVKYFEKAKQGVFDIMLRPSFSAIHGLFLIGIYSLSESSSVHENFFIKCCETQSTLQ